MPEELLKATHQAMNCRWEVFLWGKSKEELENLSARIFEDIDQWEMRLSIFIPTSEISLINSRAAIHSVRVSPEILAIIAGAFQISEITEDAFDITVGPLVKLWKSCQKQGRIPTDDEIAAARSISGRNRVMMDVETFRIAFDSPGVQIDPGAIGKGYAVDRAVEMILEAEVPGALIHAGTSTTAAIGTDPDGESWKVSLRKDTHSSNSAQVVELFDRSLSCSGNYEQYFEVDGKRFGHIIDPKTGWPVNRLGTAAVLCESAAASDALSTAALVLGEEGFRRVCGEDSGVGAIFATEEIS